MSKETFVIIVLYPQEYACRTHYVSSQQSALAYIQEGIVAIARNRGWIKMDLEGFRCVWNDLNDLIHAWNLADEKIHFQYDRIPTEYVSESKPCTFDESFA